MAKIFVPIFFVFTISILSQAQDAKPEELFKTVTLAPLNANDKKVSFKISTTAYKAHVQLEFDASKLEGEQYAVYKTQDCDKKNFSKDKLKKLNPADQFFEFSTSSGNIFEERKIDFEVASKFNLSANVFVLVKMGKQKSAILCGSFGNHN